MKKTNGGNQNNWMEDKELYSEHIEVDSDVNEDAKRELQLDASFQDWYRNIGYWVKQQEQITNVPKENVYDASITMDEDEE